ncbi:MAG: M23 family metallopeptidase [Gemmatimonadaceae bacterium]|nr:M23 family metallopeptidase [Gemmatimonadaceae bacterium]
MRIQSVLVAGVTLVSGLAACGPAGSLRGLRSEPRSAHERYARSLRDAGLDSTAMGREWLAAGDSALRSPYQVTLPRREIGVYSRDEARAVAYSFPLRAGERLRVELRAEGEASRLYLDLFEVGTDSLRPFDHLASAGPATPADSAAPALTLDVEAPRTGMFALRLQPELLRRGRFELSFRVEPTLAFPVSGRSNAAIQSLFGVDRDGGRRAHHGIDIFAPRGTPALAGADGVVRSIDPNPLGGNVVWLADERRSQVLYYAHLDRHNVVAGQRVRRGDTVGFVGNTGNARTTPPHLHFGIYRRPEGPIDPLPFVWEVRDAALAVTADTALLGRRATLRRGAPSRFALTPGGGTAATGALRPADSLRVMGAAAGTYRVQLDDGRSGYLPAGSVRAAQ